MRKLWTCVLIGLFLVLFSAAAAADMLEITEVTVEVDDDKQSADEAGGTIKILPDSELQLKVEVTNLFERGTDGGEIQDIFVNALLEEVDDGDDLEEESDDFDLTQGRDKTVTITFQIPLRLETDASYQLILTAEGEDENRTTHTDEVIFDVDVDKEKHELRFTRKELSPAKVGCAGSTNVLVGLINTGEDDEDVELIIEADDFSYNKRLEFEMAEDIDDDDNEYAFSGKIDTEDAKPGSYSVFVKALYNSGRDSIEDVLTLEVEACAADEPEPEPEPQSKPEPKEEPKTTTDTVEVITAPAPAPTPYVRPSSVAVATPKTSYSQGGWWSENKWLAVILITDLVLIIAGIIVIMAVLKRRR